MVQRRLVNILPAFLLAVLLSACGRPPMNVLLVTFDTTRADFIGCYGKESARTEHLDRLAAEGFLFEHAVASNPVTQPSHSTILTGTYPMLHGVRDNMLFHLPEERSTLAEILARQGYRTGAAVGGFPLVRSFGLDQGFEHYDDHLAAGREDHRGRPAGRSRATWYDERPAGHVNDAILPWLRGLGDEPFFVWLHYWDPHEPHIAPDPYGQLFAHDPYQGEIAYADQSLGTILRQLETSGELDNTVIVMTSDHGEGRREHGEMTHAFLAYDTTLHVPLILRVPGLEGGRRIAETVGTVDIVPTVLDLLGLEIPADIQGRSLVPLLRGVPQRARRTYYSESLSPRLGHGFGELRVLYYNQQGGEQEKYIHGPRPELFNLGQDPQERHDLAAAASPEERTRLEAALADFIVENASGEAAAAVHEVDDDTRRHLEALGYLSTGEGSKAVAETLNTDGIAPQDRVGDINLQLQLRRELDGGQFHLARRTAEKLVALAPGHPFFRAKLAAAYLGLGQTEEAAKIVDTTEDISGANLNIFLEVAWALFDRPLVHQPLVHQPLVHRPLVHRPLVHRPLADQERGRAMAQRLVGTVESAAGQLLLARMARRLDDDDAFEVAINRVLELEPENPVARLELADALIEKKLFKRAEEELQTLLTTYPAHHLAQLSYARLLAQSGRSEQALERLQRTLTLNPRACDVHLETLEVLVGLGRGGAAAEAHKKLRLSCPDHETRTRAAELLKES